MNFIPNTPDEKEKMLRSIGVGSTEELFTDVPASVRLKRPLNLPEGLTEIELGEHMKGLAGRNLSTEEAPCFMGAGTYDHFIPSVVHHLLGRSEFYTAYTPYQAEMSQGILQAIYEYQSHIAILTGMDVANASLYDGATAVTEAALMAAAVTRRGKILVPASLHPEYRQVLETYGRPRGLEITTFPTPGGVVEPAALTKGLREDVAGVIIQNPNFFGLIEDGPAIAEAVKKAGALFIVAANPISLGVLKAPGEYGADIVVGDGQPLGNPMAFGGPHLGFMAAREEYVRRMPGRIVGATVDGAGRRGFVLTLQTREQHIRREKATSNICSNQALNALAAAIYLTVVGPEGLREVASASLNKAHYAQKALAGIGWQPVFHGPFFHEFAVRCPGRPEEINAYLADMGIIGGVPLGRWYPEYEDVMLFCVTEKRSRGDIENLVTALGGWK